MLDLVMKVTGAGRLAKGFEKAAKSTPDCMLQFVTEAGYVVQKSMKKNLTGGNPLNVRTNRLRGSIQVKAKGRGKTAESRTGTKVKYGAVHEFGATINSTWGRGHGVRQIKIPAKPWANPALESNRKKIARMGDKAVGRMLKGAGL